MSKCSLISSLFLSSRFMLLFLDDLIFTRDLIPFQISEDLALLFSKNCEKYKALLARLLRVIAFLIFLYVAYRLSFLMGSFSFVQHLRRKSFSLHCWRISLVIQGLNLSLYSFLVTFFVEQIHLIGG